MSQDNTLPDGQYLVSNDKGLGKFIESEHHLNGEKEAAEYEKDSPGKSNRIRNNERYRKRRNVNVRFEGGRSVVLTFGIGIIPHDWKMVSITKQEECENPPDDDRPYVLVKIEKVS
jgi:hypothetical protein